MNHRRRCTGLVNSQPHAQPSTPQMRKPSHIQRIGMLVDTQHFGSVVKLLGSTTSSESPVPYLPLAWRSIPFAKPAVSHLAQREIWSKASASSRFFALCAIKTLLVAKDRMLLIGVCVPGVTWRRTETRQYSTQSDTCFQLRSK